MNRLNLNILDEILVDFRRDFEKNTFTFNSKLIYTYKKLIKFMLMADVIDLHQAEELSERLNEELERMEEYY